MIACQWKTFEVWKDYKQKYKGNTKKREKGKGHEVANDISTLPANAYMHMHTHPCTAMYIYMHVTLVHMGKSLTSLV